MASLPVHAERSAAALPPDPQEAVLGSDFHGASVPRPPFLRLPTEVVHHILGYVKGGRWIREDRWALRRVEEFKERRRDLLSVLKTCRQLYDFLAPLLYSEVVLPWSHIPTSIHDREECREALVSLVLFFRTVVRWPQHRRAWVRQLCCGVPLHVGLFKPDWWLSTLEEITPPAAEACRSSTSDPSDLTSLVVSIAGIERHCGGWKSVGGPKEHAEGDEIERVFAACIMLLPSLRRLQLAAPAHFSSSWHHSSELVLPGYDTLSDLVLSSVLGRAACAQDFATLRMMRNLDLEGHKAAIAHGLPVLQNLESLSFLGYQFLSQGRLPPMCQYPATSYICPGLLAVPSLLDLEHLCLYSPQPAAGLDPEKMESVSNKLRHRLRRLRRLRLQGVDDYCDLQRALGPHCSHFEEMLPGLQLLSLTGLVSVASDRFHAAFIDQIVTHCSNTLSHLEILSCLGSSNPRPYRPVRTFTVAGLALLPRLRVLHIEIWLLTGSMSPSAEIDLATKLPPSLELLMLEEVWPFRRRDVVDVPVYRDRLYAVLAQLAQDYGNAASRLRKVVFRYYSAHISEGVWAEDFSALEEVFAKQGLEFVMTRGEYYNIGQPSEEFDSSL